MIWILFLISSAVIIFSGIKLTHYADALSDRLKLGKALVGAVLLGFVTSLPEAISTLYAVWALNSPDLAVGNLLGSNNFNPMILVIMDLALRNAVVTDKIDCHRSHTQSYAFIMALSGVVLLDLLFDSLPGLGPFTLGNVLLVLIYLAGLKSLSACHQDVLTPEEEQISHQPLKIIVGKMLFMSVLIIGAAMVLANSADQIAEMTGLGQTFVGSILLAFVTSLPEIVVSLSALKMNQLDLAVGNIFGSNMFNIFIVSVCSFLTMTPLLDVVSVTHTVTIALSMILVTIAIIGMKQNQKFRIAGMGWDTVLMTVCFLIGNGILYYFR